MPPIRSVPPIKPMKTERTHEENQERAYIAASRRSDRSLEARIESARRASEIHKKRTGRGLRVTEQDVINEEMYEEEDEDMPSQYQRLSAHLHTNSMMFNRKLQDYIATQAAVRQSFYAQYQNPIVGPYGQQFSSNTAGNQFSQQSMNPFMHQQMPPPQQNFNQTPQTFNQNTQQPYAQQMFRSAPYSIPPRPNAHQRSASLSLPQQMPTYQQSPQPSNAAATTPQAEEQRRLSLPPQVLEQASQSFADGSSRPTLSRSTTAQGLKQPNTSPRQQSPQASTNSPRSAQSTSPGSTTPITFTSTPMPQSNLFSMSLPPESQQLVAPALDPKDPTAAMFMAGSENLPMPTYHYNPNLSPKSSRMSGTLAPGMMISNPITSNSDDLNKSHNFDSMTDPSSAMSDDFMFSSMASNPMAFDLGSQGELFPGMGLPSSQEEYDPNVFVNFDQ